MSGPVVYEELSSRVVFGPGCVADVPDELASLGVSRALLIAGASERETADALAAALGKACVATSIGVRQHVPREAAHDARRAAREAGADSIVSLGGGSAVGLAKAVALTEGLPIVAVPTTYSGSELTPVWGITADGRKQTGRDERVLPRTVVYDPELTLTLPPRVSAASGMNAVAHAVEALWADRANPVTSALADEAIGALASALPRVVAEPSDLGARSDALRGAWLGGLTLRGAGSSLHHALCHVLGGAFDLPHAETHAALLPHVTAFVAPAAPEAVARAAQALGVADAAAGLYELVRGLGLPTSLAELGLTAEQAERAVEIALGSGLPSPRPLRRDELAELVGRALAGSPPEPAADAEPEQHRHVHCGADVFRDVIGHFATGVTIVTARDGDTDFGVTASAVTSLSLDPPMLLVCLNKQSRTRGAVSRSGSFAVNILDERQGPLALRFATDRDDKFDGVSLRRGDLAHPLLEDALAHLECRVVEEVTGGTHSVFLAVVQRAERFDGAPLAYFRGKFGRLTLAHEALAGTV